MSIKNKILSLATVISILISTSPFFSNAAQATWLLEPEVNSGSVELSKKFEFSPGEAHESSLTAFSVGVQGGYEFKNHIFIKGGLTDGETENLLGWQDRIKFYDKHISTGVQWPVGKRISLLGAIGVSDWDYITKDYQDSLQDNQKDKHYSGTGIEYRAGINFRFNRLMSLDLYGGEKRWDDQVSYTQYGVSLCFRFD